MEKEYLIECRGLTWPERCDFEDFRDNFVKENGKNYSAVGRALVNYILAKIYPDAPLSKMTAAEVMAVYESTMQLTDSIREEEIKNFKPLSGGSTNEQATVKTAED